MPRLHRLIALTLLGLAACAGKQPVAVVPASGVTLLDALPQPTSRDAQQATRQTFVGSFTELSVDVYGIPDLQREILTDGEGKFSFPLIGTLDGAGKSPTQLAGEIEDRLRGRFVRDPQVTVNFKAATSPLHLLSQAVTVDGQVQRPGQYPLVGRQTLMRAVSLAGGLTELAKRDDVLVFRKVENQQYVGIYNLQAIRRGNYADPEIFPNDVIVVGDSSQRRLFEDVIKAATLLSTPLIVLTNLTNNN
ncbi:polysaccharide export protein [Sphingopyxis terrae subsp. terrae NBRC 15098]|jgi:polysaccharide export outer membrane protein|uniref:Polysaccharide export protein n=1 Tax=Sphingopyxis terrae subsp. terrae NBRC 15098 TaxID=1219058 RepID=A0A142W271_9SPHN|nr:polysaccharide export protein [Sphingopyxis terrae subsp. terrae NBRC 15098]